MTNLITKQFNNKLISFDLTSEMLVSLTDMAKACGKLIGHWTSLKSTEEFLNEYSSVIGKPITEIIIVKQGGISTEQGTWANQDVAIEFARWCSPKFAIWCNQQIKELLTTGKVELRAKTALELAREQVLLLEQLDKVTHERDEAIKTKAYISDKKTATAMNTASRLSRELGKAKEWATVKRVAIATGEQYSWKMLKQFSLENNIDIQQAFDTNYGSVKSYHAEAWSGVYGIDISLIP